MARHDDRQERGAMFSTALGWMGLSWRGSQVTAATFGHRWKSAAQRALGHHAGHLVHCQTVDVTQPCPQNLTPAQWELVQRLTAFAEGHPDQFEDVRLNLSHLTDFQRQVVDACRRIGYGHTLTYADLAKRAGSPRAARAVGNVMRTNRFPLLVPCHRVVGAAGSLGGYSAPDGLAMKERLLEMEAGTACASG